MPGGYSSIIAYGGHSGSREEDSLAYWLNKLRHDLLSVSYTPQSEPHDIVPPVVLDFESATEAFMRPK